MTPAEIFDYARKHGVTLAVDGDRLVIEADNDLPDVLVDAARRNKAELLEVLAARHEAREERAAIMAYDGALDRQTAESQARARIQYVTCGSCAYWTGSSPCGAGLHTSGDPMPGVAVRICGFHTPKGVRS